MSDTTTLDGVKQARAAMLIERANAEASYYRLARTEMERQVVSSVSGAIPSRLDTLWPAGDSYQGENRLQDYYGIERVRERAAFLEQDNWLAAGVLDRSVENVVGPTIRIEPRTGDPATNKKIKKLWKRFATTTACDIRGENTLGQMLRLMQRCKIRDGDCGMLLTYQIDFDGKRIPRLQLIEPHRIETPGNLSLGYQTNGTQVVNGVEMNANGKPTGFHIRYTDPSRVTKYVRVDARDFIFIKNVKRYSDVRGMSAFVGGFTLFDQIMGYLDSVVVAARVGASQAMIAKRRNPANVLNQMATLNRAVSPGLQRNVSIQPGTINVLNTDEDIVPFNPAQPQQQFPAALDAFCRILGTKFGLTLEQVLLNYSLTTYSSGKMAQHQAKVTSGIEQEDLAQVCLSRVYGWWMSIMVERGELTIPSSVDEPWAHEWIPPARPSPEPLRDMQARELALKLRIETRSNMAMEDGYDFSDLVEQGARDEADLQTAGLGESPEGGNASQFTQDMLKGFMVDPGARAIMFNRIDLAQTFSQVGITTKPAMTGDDGIPLLPVVGWPGPLVSGAKIYGPDGKLVGGDVENPEPANAPMQGGGARNADAAPTTPTDNTNAT